MDLKGAIEKAKEQLKNRKSNTDVVDLEIGFREITSELYMKRDEVTQLRTDLDAANLELQNLRAALYTAKKSSDENQFKLNIMLTKSRGSEEELQKKREALMEIQLQHNMTVAEVETLKEILIKSETEKIELSRKVDVLEKKLQHNAVYHDEISRRDSRLRTFMGELNEQMNKLQAGHIQAIELSNKAQLVHEATEKFNNFGNEFTKLKKEKEHFQEMFICANAKYEKIKEYLEKDTGLQEPNLVTKIILNQWKINKSHHMTRLRGSDEILSKISESLNTERSTNQKLINENERICEKYTKLNDENLILKDTIEELSHRVKEFEEKHRGLDTSAKNETNKSIKEEPIEID